jgi:hypothetical protein
MNECVRHADTVICVGGTPEYVFHFNYNGVGVQALTSNVVLLQAPPSAELPVLLASRVSPRLCLLCLLRIRLRMDTYGMIDPTCGTTAI